ncbi:hypothetical protein UlMin_003277 [Ulmus minor]
MSSATKAWIVAASIGGVEALKDQLGVCRWNFVLRSVHLYAKKNIRSFSQAKVLSSQCSSALSNVKDEKLKKSVESFSKVMYLNCWGS